MRISKVKTPKIGLSYSVPCVSVEQCAVTENDANVPEIFRYKYIPVVGVNHNDSIYRFGTEQHIHFDWRFLPNDIYKAYLRVVREYKADHHEESYTRDPKTSYSHMVRFPLYTKTKHAPLVHKQMEMLREPPPMELEQVGFMLYTLQKAFCKVRIDPKNPVCPHRKAALNGAVEEDGCLVCPCHGLRWDKQTGEMKVMKLPDYARC